MPGSKPTALTLVSLFAVSLLSYAAAQSTTAGPDASIMDSLQGRFPCFGEVVWFAAKSQDETYVHSWFVNGRQFGEDQLRIEFEIDSREGYSIVHKMVSRPTDTAAAPRTASASLNFSVMECGDRAATPSAGPTTSPAPDFSARSAQCEDLAAERDKWLADWKYRYTRHYEEKGHESGSDREFESKMNAEREQYMAAWSERWKAAGCDSTADADAECRQLIANAQPALEAHKSRFAERWRMHWLDLEAAREEMRTSGVHSDEEWREFELQYSGLKKQLTDEEIAEREALVAEYGLARCYYYFGSDASPPVDYGRDLGSTAPPRDAYARAVAACDERVAALKAKYAPELAALVTAAREDDPQARDRLDALELRLRAEMESLMQECRADYKQDYEPPENYRDGAGALRCYFDTNLGRVVCQGRYVGFQGNPDTQSLHRLTCGGQLFFDDVFADSIFEDFVFEATSGGSVLAIRSSNLKILLHDSPRGVINVGLAGDASLYITPAPYLQVEAGPGKVVLRGAGAHGAWVGDVERVRYDEARRQIVVRGEATWVSESCIPDGSKPDGGEDPKYFDAIQRRRLGAAITIVREGDGVVQSNETYDERVDVRVRRDGGRYEATIDGQECKTVVLRFDEAIFESIRLRVLLADEAGNALGIQEASSLEDVLDPCDDGAEGFEYWIVQDRFGVQVLVSFAHFSEKRVSVEAASVSNIIVPGFGLGAVVGGVVCAVAAAVVWRRLTR